VRAFNRVEVRAKKVKFQVLPARAVMNDGRKNFRRGNKAFVDIDGERERTGPGQPDISYIVSSKDNVIGG
jgi:hypothetical protein